MKNIASQKNISYKNCNIDYYSSNRILGFWLYLMSDIIVFSILFAVYLVMINNTAHELAISQNIIQYFSILVETIILLLSSFSCSIAIDSFKKKDRFQLTLFLIITFLLGFIFVYLEMLELNNLINTGFSPFISGYISSFFVLLVTHCVHVIIALIWILVIIQQIFYFGFTYNTYIRILCFSLFWHFLDIIWIFIFSIVYLMGAI